ncbi:hypothetical protein [Bradyrhizobium sp. RDM4]|jgi:hypothetical protein|uniref:hypothetical protein n=1 Tax=Bradyrhizobium sp. RDM4 TaxID=3378765 RepID=UPI0038FBF19D
MESFTRSVDYLGNLKARIIPKIVRISFAQLLRLFARGAQARDNHASRSVGKAPRAHHSRLKQKWWARRFAPLPTLQSCGERQRQPRLDPYSPEMFLPV